MAQIIQILTARKAHPCSGGYCRRGVQAGERYTRWTVTPYDQESGNDGPRFIHGAECKKCAEDMGRPIEGAMA